MYIVDTNNHSIRKVAISTGIVTTIAGTGFFSILDTGDGGAATSAFLGYPYGVALDTTGNSYFFDYFEI